MKGVRVENMGRSDQGIRESQMAAAISQLMEAHNRTLPLPMRLSSAAIKSRAKEVLPVYREAWRVGSGIHRVESLGLNHCMKVVRSWRERGLSRHTVEKRWNTLVYFLNVMGKSGMLPPLQEVWPAEEYTEEPGERRVSLKRLSDEQYQQVISGFKPDSTKCFVLRLERELGFKREEALMTNFDGVAAKVGASVLATRGGGRKMRRIPIETAAQARLVAEVQAYLEVQQRPRLLQPVVTLTQATGRITNSLAHQTRKIKAEQGGESA